MSPRNEGLVKKCLSGKDILKRGKFIGSLQEKGDIKVGTKCLASINQAEIVMLHSTVHNSEVLLYLLVFVIKMFFASALVLM